MEMTKEEFLKAAMENPARSSREGSSTPINWSVAETDGIQPPTDGACAPGQLGKLLQGILPGGQAGVGRNEPPREGFRADSHQDGPFSGTGCENS